MSGLLPKRAELTLGPISHCQTVVNRNGKNQGY